MKRILILLLILAFLYLHPHTKGETAATPPPTTFSLQNHPALLALAKNAPRDSQGKFLLIHLGSESLQDPLQGRRALVSPDGGEFTIVPQASILPGNHFSTAQKMISSTLPAAATFVSLKSFLTAVSGLTTIPIRSRPDGHFGLTEREIFELQEQYGQQLILLVDAATSLPISQWEKISQPKDVVAP